MHLQETGQMDLTYRTKTVHKIQRDVSLFSYHPMEYIKVTKKNFVSNIFHVMFCDFLHADNKMNAFLKLHCTNFTN